MRRAISNRRKSLVKIFLFLLLPGVAVTAHSQVLTLDSVLTRVDNANPMLREYSDRISAAEAYSDGARAWMAPMVGVGPYWFPYPGQMTMDPRDEGMFMGVIEQDIPNPAKLRAKKEFMSAQTRIEQENRAVLYNRLRAEAKTLYLSSLVAAEKLRVVREGQEIVELMLRLARIRYPYNQSSVSSIYKAEGRLAELRNMEYMTLGALEENEIKLRSLMNVAEGERFSIDTSFTVSWTPLDVADTSELGKQRSDVRQIDETIRSMSLNQQLQRLSAKPDFRIRFEHMQPRSGEMPTQFSAMAMVTIPIAPWASRMYKSEVRGMQYEIEAMRKERAGLLNEVRGMVAGMNAQLARMKQQLANYEKAILPALEKNYQALMLAYEENTEQLPAVVDGWEAYNMARQEYLDRKEEYYKMIVAYEQQLER